MFSTLIAKAVGLFAGKASLLKWVVLGVGLVAVAIVILWLLWARAELRADLTLAEMDLAAMTTAYEANREALAELEQISEAKDKALAARDRAIKVIVAERDAVRRKWQEALRNEPETRDWADTPLPDAVHGLLQ